MVSVWLSSVLTADCLAAPQALLIFQFTVQETKLLPRPQASTTDHASLRPRRVGCSTGLILHQAAVTNTHQCYVEPGFDYIDNDIGYVASSTADGCCAKCEATTGCKAYSWTDMNGGTCWLKSGRGTIVVNATVQSATMQPLDDSGNFGGCQLDEGIDYVGYDIGSVHMLKPLSCCSACYYFPGCRAFTFTTHNGGTCWLKNRKDGVIPKEGVTSAQVKANPASPSCALELNVDYVGNDIGNAPSTDPYACCSKCMAKSGCHAFSWSDHLGGTCWFKSAKGATAANAGVKSAIV